MFTGKTLPGFGLGRIAAGVNQAMVSMMFLSALAVAGSVRADDTLKQAGEDFRSYCAPCHGVDGRGDGPASQVLKTRPADLTQLSKQYGGTFPTETIYKRIEGLDMPAAHGDSDMPVWGMWFTNQAVGESLLMKDAKPAAERVNQRIRALVAYLKTIQEE